MGLLSPGLLSFAFCWGDSSGIALRTPQHHCKPLRLDAEEQRTALLEGITVDQEGLRDPEDVCVYTCAWCACVGVCAYVYMLVLNSVSLCWCSRLVLGWLGNKDWLVAFFFGVCFSGKFASNLRYPAF